MFSASSAVSDFLCVLRVNFATFAVKSFCLLRLSAHFPVYSNSSDVPRRANQARTATRPRPGRQPCYGDRGRHHHRQRNFSGSFRDDAGGRLGQTGLPGMVCGRTAFLFRSTHLRRTGRDAAPGRWRIHLRARRLWALRRISLCVDHAAHLETRVNRDDYHRVCPHSR